jgi:hypothetical protein
MKSVRRGAAPVRAAGSVARPDAHLCEPLEPRRLLADDDPVIVLTEAFSLTSFPNVTSQTVRPRLWSNPHEFPWNLALGNWNTTDGDGNGFPDDAYGWNFRDGVAGSPNVVRNGSVGGHGAATVGKVLHVLAAAGEHGDRVRIMHVIGSGAEITQYVMGEKAKGVNVVAVSHSTPGGFFQRADAEILRDRGILLFVGSSDAGSNADADPVAPTSPSFYHATPRFGIQQPAVHTIIPATTDPRLGQSDFGINSFYFAAPGAEAQSYTAAIAAAYAGIAVEAYQEAHKGDTPSAEQIKRAMMSGVEYLPALDLKTITHDYANGQRRDGGLLSPIAMIAAINQTTPEITDVSMTQTAVDPFGTRVDFALDSMGADVSNWTISWGDSSGANRSGVEVIRGDLDEARHTFPFENVPHRYFPTIYAMSGTKQVYLPVPSAQREVVITTPFAPTSGQDHYTLTRSGADTVLTLENPSGTVSRSFAPGELPTCSVTLGEGQDILTVDFLNGDPLVSTALSVTGHSGTGARIRVIGTAGDDLISVTNATLVNVNGSAFPITANLPVFVDAGDGDDQVSAVASACTLIGGAGDDLLHLPFAQLFPYVIDGGADTDIDTLKGVAGPDANVSDVEYFVTTDASNNIHVKRHDVGGLLLFSLQQHPGGHTSFQIEGALHAVELDAFGTLTYGDSDGELVPIDPVTSLLINGQDKAEQFDIEANVNVTVTGGGGNDWSTVTAPNATITGGAGNDTVHTGNIGNYRIDPGRGANTLRGGNGVDFVRLAYGASDVLYLGGGDDVVDARHDGFDDDYIDGGAGHDTLYIRPGFMRSNVHNIEAIIGNVTGDRARRDNRSLA